MGNTCCVSRETHDELLKKFNLSKKDQNAPVELRKKSFEVPDISEDGY